MHIYSFFSINAQHGAGQGYDLDIRCSCTLQGCSTFSHCRSGSNNVIHKPQPFAAYIC